MTAVISLKSVSKVYRTSEVETAALDGVSLEVQPGEFVAVMGPSGCGKSTLLNILGLIDAPSKGEFVFLGEHVERANETRLTGLRKKNIGFIFQSFNLIDELSVYENVELALLYHRNLSGGERRRRVTASLDRVGMLHRRRHVPAQLSGGQQQRVAVARAVVSKPSLILADEPTGNLDSKNGEEVMGLLGELNREGTTIVMVTHSAPQADQAKRVVEMLDGRVVSERATRR